MKKFILTAPLVLPMTTWQTWDGVTLNVHTTNDPNSPLCFSGKIEDYHGMCTNPQAPTRSYILKVIKNGGIRH